jgi:lipopolysaccharide assembly outer membrane protein LptD (OstA)
MDAFSNVRIVNESVTITGNKLEYDGKTKIANVINNVKLRDGSSTLSTAKLQYDMSSRTATYTTGGTIINNKDKNTLTSVYGQYRPDKKLFYFRNNVKLVSKDYTMTGDSLQYNTANESAIFTGPTWIQSEKKRRSCCRVVERSPGRRRFYSFRHNDRECGKRHFG